MGGDLHSAIGIGGTLCLLTRQATCQHLVCAFLHLSWMTGLVLEPLPTGAWAFLGVTTAVFTKTLTFSQAFTAFTNDVIWLIVVSFFFAAVKTALNELLLMDDVAALAARPSPHQLLLFATNATYTVFTVLLGIAVCTLTLNWLEHSSCCRASRRQGLGSEWPPCL